MNPLPHDPTSATATVSFSLKGVDYEMEARVTVPAGPARVSDLLPLARGLSDRVVEETTKAVEQQGRRISCCKGCGACCSNLVAISEVEARRIAEVVNEMPEARQSEIRARFAAARARLVEAGLMERLQASADWTDAEYGKLTGDYFRLRVACPFLEEGACSIYGERPVTCREFLVVSPPEYCAMDDSREVIRVRMLLPVFQALAQWQVAPAKHFLERVVPLILALEWSEAHPEPDPVRSGPELLEEFVRLLSVEQKS